MMLLGLLAVVPAAKTQEVIAPPPDTPALPPALQEIEANQVGTIPTGQSVPPVLEERPFQYGPLTLRPHFSYRFLYGTGIQSSPGQARSSITQGISPGLLLEVGDHWTLDYTPTWTLYSNNQFDDTLSHSVRLIGATTYEDWTLRLWQTYRRSSTPQTETAQQTEQETVSTSLNASHPLSSQLSLDLSGSQNLRFAQNFTDSLEWSTMDWLSYQFWPRFNAGVGVGAGYIDVTPGIDQVYEQFQGRINWQATDKVVFQLSGGLEMRQFSGSTAQDVNNPIFGASIQYQPFEVTTLSLSANRAVTTSYFTNQVTETTSITGTLNQRLLEKIYLSLKSGYQIATYSSVISGASARRDEYYFVNVRLSSNFLKRGTVAAFYQFTSNSSSQGGFGYSSNQTGFEIGYRY